MARQTKPERKMVKLAIYLYKNCARSRQEGVIYLINPENHSSELHFDYLDTIPERIRELLKSVGLTYDIADDSDNTVITAKSRKSKVVKKIRLSDHKNT